MKRTGTFEQMINVKKRLTQDVLKLESDTVSILIVPHDISEMLSVLREFSRKPTDEEIRIIKGDILYTIRKITYVGSSILYSDLSTDAFIHIEQYILKLDKRFCFADSDSEIKQYIIDKFEDVSDGENGLLVYHGVQYDLNTLLSVFDSVKVYKTIEIINRHNIPIINVVRGHVDANFYVIIDNKGHTIKRINLHTEKTAQTI